MSFHDFLRQRMMQADGPIQGPPWGDHRMDTLETQRGQAYPNTPRPGMVCYEDGSCVTQAQFNAKGDQMMDPVENNRRGVYPRTPLPGMVCFEDGSCVPAAEANGPMYGTATRSIPPVAPTDGRATATQPSRDGFAALLLALMARGQPPRVGGFGGGRGGQRMGLDR